jgi:hypothetical protein
MIATCTSENPARAEIDGVLHDVDFVRETWGNVDRRVGDDQRVLVAGDIHHKQC